MVVNRRMGNSLWSDDGIKGCKVCGISECKYPGILNRTRQKLFRPKGQVGRIVLIDSLPGLSRMSPKAVDKDDAFTS